MGEMTNEQAARWLKDLLKSDLPMEQYQTALEKGIEALEQEPCNTDTCKVAKAYMNEWDKPNNSDEISRQAVLDITWEEPSYTDPLNVLTEIRDKIKDLPSVNPQEPKTKWIPVSERLPYPWDEKYLVSLAWGGIGVMEYKSTGFHNYGSFTPVPIESIIAWMPLPEPWKGERNEHLIDRQAVIDKDTNVPSKDSIDRQAVLDCLTATNLKKFDFILDARDKIKNLSSVKPQEPTEWQQDHEILKAYSDGANEMLDKIRSEVEDINPWAIRYAPLEDGDTRPKIVTNVKSHVLEIIDKYKEDT